MADNKSFDKKTYDKAYNKSHYTQSKLWIKNDISAQITDYCKEKGISKNQLFIQSALYIIDNNIDISSFQADSGNKE